MAIKTCFIDRDGTLIQEPDDEQVDTIDKLDFLPGVFTALTRLQAAGFRLIMVSNQDGLGTSAFSRSQFETVQNLMLKVFNSQGIYFDAIRICPHFAEENCDCRKPQVGLVLDYLKDQSIDRQNSYVIGDRESDSALADNLGIQALRIDQSNWQTIATQIIDRPRIATMERITYETQIQCRINLDVAEPIRIRSGIAFFDHMLEQIAKQAGISIELNTQGDLNVDDHHTVEDVALVLGQAVRQALGDKRGIARYGFCLPMDEALTTLSLDLSGRPYCKFQATFNREKIGELSTELISHFFRSFADASRSTLHVSIRGENTHHMIESAFKALGRTLRQAIKREGETLASTKGVL